MTSTPKHSVSVSACVMNDEGKVLAIRRRDNGHWEPPGGVLELEEGIHEGLVREVLEETGITVEPGPLTGVYKNMERGIVALVFRCGVRGGIPTTTAEAAELAWLSRDEVLTQMSSAYACRMLDALEAPPHPAVRLHDGVAVFAFEASQPS